MSVRTEIRLNQSNHAIKKLPYSLCKLKGINKHSISRCLTVTASISETLRFWSFSRIHSNISAIKKCELACRPVGYTFYQGVGRNATNGTSCDSDGSVCVNGVCKVNASQEPTLATKTIW